MGDYMRSVGAVCREPEYCFTICHDGEYREHDIDVEICEAVVAPCAESDRVKFREVDAVATAACAVHHGPYDRIGETYNQLFEWIEASALGRRVAVRRRAAEAIDHARVPASSRA